MKTIVTQRDCTILYIVRSQFFLWPTFYSTFLRFLRPRGTPCLETRENTIHKGTWL